MLGTEPSDHSYVMMLVIYGCVMAIILVDDGWLIMKIRKKKYRSFIEQRF